jgi:salicylate hydroxylase
MSDPEIKALYEGQLPGFLGIRDPIDDVLFVNYPCRDNEVMNCAVVHNSRHQQTEDEITSWNEPVPWTEILETARNFHPTAKKILSMASDAESDVKVHHLMKRAPMSSYVRDRAVVIGDAAHVMMPTHAAGGAVTIESAACLGILFDKISTPTDTGLIEGRLKLFDKLRLGRCNMTMILSNAGFAGIGAPSVEEEVRRYYDGPLPPSGSTPWSAEIREIFFNYNALEEARKVLHEELLE